MRIIGILGLVFGIFVHAPPALAFNDYFLEEGNTRLPLIGQKGFCERNPEQCEITDSSTVVWVTKEVMDAIDDVHEDVQRRIEPATDQEVHGVEEKWVLDPWKGDCEDYVLTKRAFLIRRGLPANALRITYVLDEDGEGHLVLTVKSDLGEIVLDNKKDSVVWWDEWRSLPYEWIKRTSGRDPKTWVSIKKPDITVSRATQ